MKDLNKISTSSFFCSKAVIECNKTLSPREVILSLLKARNWTQSKLAKEIGISKQALHNYLKGVWDFPTRTKIKIAETLSVDSAVIWGFK